MHCRIQRTNNVLSVLYGGGVCTPLLITLVHIMSKLECRSVELLSKDTNTIVYNPNFYATFFQLFFSEVVKALILKEL